MVKIETPYCETGTHSGRSVQEVEFLKGAEWQQMSPRRRKNYIERVFRYWRQRGFPYYSLSDDQIRRQFQQLVTLCSEKMFLPDSEIQWSNAGLALANYFHPQMWLIKSDTYLSPMECFQDNKVLKACIQRALEIWPNRYAANPSNLRRMLSSFTNAKRVSNFRPTVAKAIYERYSTQWSRVLDFCAGFGGRLLGCLALERDYVGYEPSQSQFQGLQRMFTTIRALGLTSCHVDLQLASAEDAMRKEASRSFDLVFTSPPYFDRERYSSDNGQSYMRYRDYASWREYFLHRVLVESWRVLRNGKVLILNVANTEDAPIADDTKALAGKYFDLMATYRLRLGRLPYRRGASACAYHYEPVFVFAKRG
jgi:SAM-dependent methyltransferase